jgi:DNA-binding FadR family transcriptional regulator
MEAEASRAILPVKRRKLSDEVARRIEELILDGTFAPDEALPSERELMRTFEVGRPSIREALFRLQKMGLVALGNGERARVTSPTPETLIGELSGAARSFLATADGMRHFQEARREFEVVIAQLAARQRATRGIEGLKRALAANKAALGDLGRFERTDVAFHYELAAMTGNPIFTAMHNAIVEWLTAQRSVVLRVDGADRIALRAHELIFATVDAGDPAAASQAMREHLETIADLYRRATEGH